jgi:hypothetical protein
MPSPGTWPATQDPGNERRGPPAGIPCHLFYLARARARLSDFAVNSRMGFLKTQRAVVFWSAEKEPDKPSVPWGSQLSVLAIVCWEPRPRPPFHRR